MATVAQIRADLVGSSAVFRAEMVSAARQANQSLSDIRASTRATANAIADLGSTAEKFLTFAAARAGIQALIEAQRSMQQIQFSLLSATGSTASAAQVYDQVASVAKRLGLSLQPTALEFSRLSAAASANGVSMRDQMALFEGVAKSSAVLHLSSEQTERAILALSQMFSKGKVQAQELQLQLGQAIPGVVPRFQQAMLAMLQGTDLAGKSFSKLLEEGDLTIAMALPALVKALDGTGRGAEEAAHGLNAAINNMSTAWFEFKANMSSGAFADAAIASINALASHLQSLTAVAGAAVLTGASRFVGTRVQGAVDASAQARAAAAADRESAAAAAQRASALIEEAAASERNAAAAIRALEALKLQAAQSREAALAAKALAQAELDAARATSASAADAAALSANLQAQAEAEARAAAAAKALKSAEDAYASARSAVRNANAQIAEQEDRIRKARITGATAAEDLAAAEKRLAAQPSIGARIGNTALNFVGGWYGVATLAIAGLGTAMVSAYERQKQWRQETQEQIKSLEQLGDQARATADAFSALDASMTARKALDVYTQTQNSIASTSKQIADLKSQIAEQEAMQATPMDDTGASQLLAGLRINELQSRLKPLQDELKRLQGASEQLSGSLQGSMVPAIYMARDAAEDLRAQLEKTGGSLADQKQLTEWMAYLDGMLRAMSQAQAKVAAINAEFQSDAEKFTSQAQTSGFSNVQMEQYKLRSAMAALSATGEGPDMREKRQAELVANYAKAVQAAAMADAADAAKKASDAAEAEARRQQGLYETAMRNIQERISQDEAAIHSSDRLTAAEKLQANIEAEIASGHLKLTAARRKDLEAALAQAVATGKAAAALAEQRKQAEALAVAQENIARIQADVRRENSDTLAGMSRGGQFAEDAAAQRRIQQQYEDLMTQAGRQFARGDISKATYDAEIAAYRAAMREELAEEQRFFNERDRMQADWLIGAQRAMDQYMTDGRDVASETANAFSDAFSAMEDALVKFAQNGKLSFTDLANSIISDIIRIEVKAAASGILGQIMGSVMPIVSDGTSQSWLTGSAGADVSSYAKGLGTDFGGLSGLLFGGGRASGGPTSGGKLYEVAEGGAPELFRTGSRTFLLSGQDGFVSPASSAPPTVTASSSSSPVTVNVINNQSGAVAATVQQSIGSNGMPSIDIVIDAVEKRIAGNVNRGQGALSSALRARFGLNPAVNV